MNLNYKDVKAKYKIGLELISDPEFLRVQALNKLEKEKKPYRFDVINYLLTLREGQTDYLEIGVRNPEDNFNKIKANTKISVDPGIEYKENPVDFKMTSDEFFQKLDDRTVLSSDTQFDVIFIDGLHLASQVWRDIKNAERYLKSGGFIVLHDCNPPSEWHAIENYGYKKTPAQGFWNGTTWKAFVKYRFTGQLGSCCVDSDWGVGILSSLLSNPMEKLDYEFYDFYEMEKNRDQLLGLIDFSELSGELARG